MKRISTLACLAGLTLIASASPAAAAPVTVGQTATPVTTPCGAQVERVQKSVAAGTSFVVPNTGGVTAWIVNSWSTQATADANQQLKMKFYRPLGGTTYAAVAHDTQTLQPNTLNTFQTNLAVKAGDILGLNPVTQNFSGCVQLTNAPGELIDRLNASDLADGQSGNFNDPLANAYRLNISATLNPANDLSIDKVKKNKNKGTAILSVAVPNPGQLTLTGTGLKPVTSSADAATTVNLKVKSKGNKKEKLLDTGKVKVAPKVSFTPTGGTADSETQKLKLKKK